MNITEYLKTDLVKTLCALFLFLVLLAALGLYCYDKIANLPIDPLVNNVLVAGVTTALTALGFSHGINVANGVASSTAKEVVQAVRLQPGSTESDIPHDS